MDTTISPATLSNIETHSPFNENHSLAIRIWHWTFFLVLTASLVTVAFGSTLFRTRGNITLVQDQLQQKGVTVSKDQAQAVAHEFSDKLWDLHKWIGYVLCGLLLSRILIEFFQPGEERFRVKLKKALGYGEAQQHYIRVKNTYLVFYGLILIMALTGLGLAFEGIPFLKSIHTPVKKIHTFVQYFIYGFILIHLIGVLKADMGNHRGLVSGMIHGKKRL